jgi:hypothetical protein
MLSCSDPRNVLTSGLRSFNLHVYLLNLSVCQVPSFESVEKSTVRVTVGDTEGEEEI